MRGKNISQDNEMQSLMKSLTELRNECESNKNSYYKEFSPEIEIDIVEYIKDCSTEQQQRLSHDNHKNHKLLDASIKHKKTLLRNQD